MFLEGREFRFRDFCKERVTGCLHKASAGEEHLDQHGPRSSDLTQKTDPLSTLRDIYAKRPNTKFKT